MTRRTFILSILALPFVNNRDDDCQLYVPEERVNDVMELLKGERNGTRN